PIERLGAPFVEPLRIHPHGRPATAPVVAAAGVRPDPVAAADPGAPRVPVAALREPEPEPGPAGRGPEPGPGGREPAAGRAGAGCPAAGWTSRTTRSNPTRHWTKSMDRAIPAPGLRPH